MASLPFVVLFMVSSLGLSTGADGRIGRSLGLAVTCSNAESDIFNALGLPIRSGGSKLDDTIFLGSVMSLPERKCNAEGRTYGKQKWRQAALQGQWEAKGIACW